MKQKRIDDICTEIRRALKVPPYRDFLSYARDLRRAFDTAKAFIDSAADPDITMEMIEKYAEYQEALEMIERSE